MKTRFKSWLAKVLQNLLGRVLSGYNEVEHKNRIDEVCRFFYETLPQVSENYGQKAIIEGGMFNYFELPSGGWSKFDIVIPDQHLYVVVGGIGTASWEEARLRGVSRGAWELAQADAATYAVEIAALPVPPGSPKPRLLFISWGESVRGPALLTKLQHLVGSSEGE